ncbi:hypothetical protein BA895_11330 [Humibacillus sp. DSM 29435]|uniref:TetR/AcrR family transcriptional regulator n=1 Tax=Humibacillus sp. DSM 29435 TaxID=1869167 RepID=UPI000871EB4A|nr:TetR/AcrR family transcriptional regulator [Humibacillus sp. DSM 29435]OFE14207.1 hypothetical protein BA895_11330 [Humibacillus sp. DSM 29435]
MAITDQPLGKRARQRAQTEAEILRVAREHLAIEGAAALSLRAIARDLGMVSSGLYRYVDSRDDLLTRLIVDSYRSLAAAVQAAHDAVDPTDLDGRWVAIGLALRRWALDRPHDFALIYGSPVPDYEAPDESTVEAGTQVLALLLRLVQDAADQHRLVLLAPSPEAARAVGAMLDDPFFAEVTIGATMLARSLSAWTLLLGAVTSEVFLQLGPVPDAAALFGLQLDVAGSLILLPAQPSTGLSTAVFTA